MAGTGFSRRHTPVLSFVALSLAAACVIEWRTYAQKRQWIDASASISSLSIPSAPGDRDTTFDGDGLNTVFFGTNSAQRDDVPAGTGAQRLAPNAGKIVVGGDTISGNTSDLAIARFDTAGAVDATFGDPLTPGKRTVDFGGFEFTRSTSGGHFLAIDPVDDSIVLVGQGDETSACGNPASTIVVAKFTPNGLLDSTFNPLGGADIGKKILNPGCRTLPQAVIIQPDHSIVIMALEAASAATTLIRLEPDGDLDPTFGGGVVTHPFATFGNGYGKDIKYVQSSTLDPTQVGKLVMVGAFNAPGGFPDFGVARFLSNGSLDTTFGPGNTGFVRTPTVSGAQNVSEEANAVAIKPDGRIISAGSSNNAVGGVNGSADDYIVVAYTVDGALDSSFAGGAGFVKTSPSAVNVDIGDVPYTVHIAPDTRIVVIGTGPNGGGVSIVRYLATGVPDPAFGGGDGIVLDSAPLIAGANNTPSYSGALTADGLKIFAVGSITTAAITNNDSYAVRYNSSVGQPTAARVTVSGRVITPDGAGLRNAAVTLVDAAGNARTSLTGAFGYFSVSDVELGNLIVTVNARRFRYRPRALSVSDQITDLILSPE